MKDVSAIDLVPTLSVSVVVHYQLGVLERQHFRLWEAEDCTEELLNHRFLFPVEGLRTLTKRLQNAISTMITHSGSTQKK
jgi:hypothetical protein